MNKAMALKVVNPVLAVLLVSQLVTGMARGSLSHETFEFLHEGGGITLAVVAAIHLVLNWNWVKASYFRKRKQSN